MRPPGRKGPAEGAQPSSQAAWLRQSSERPGSSAHATAAPRVCCLQASRLPAEQGKNKSDKRAGAPDSRAGEQETDLPSQLVTLFSTDSCPGLHGFSSSDISHVHQCFIKCCHRCWCHHVQQDALCSHAYMLQGEPCLALILCTCTMPHVWKHHVGISSGGERASGTVLNSLMELATPVHDT